MLSRNNAFYKLRQIFIVARLWYSVDDMESISSLSSIHARVNLVNNYNYSHMHDRNRNRNRNLNTPKESFESQAQGTSLFTSADA